MGKENAKRRATASKAKRTQRKARNEEKRDRAKDGLEDRWPVVTAKHCAGERFDRVAARFYGVAGAVRSLNLLNKNWCPKMSLPLTRSSSMVPSMCRTRRACCGYAHVLPRQVAQQPGPCGAMAWPPTPKRAATRPNP